MSVEHLSLPPHDLPPPPEYARPKLLGTYSHLPDRRIVPGDASMAYYRPAPLGADLTYGAGERIERDESVEEHLDGLVESLQRLGKEKEGGVVTWRGMLTRFMTAPFETEPWAMDAVALNGSVYLELHDPPDHRAERAEKQKAWAMPSYMGYAYEAFSTYPPEDEEVDGPKGWSGTVNTNVQWCNIVASSIGDIPVTIGGEVDCVDVPPGTPNPGLDKCVELKTNKEILDERADGIFHKKLLKHWAQSFLLGVPTVTVGFRTDAGILRSQRSFETLRIPGIVAANRRVKGWRPEPALHFLYAALEMLTRNTLPSDPHPPGTAPIGDRDPLPRAARWQVQFTPRRGIELVLLGEEEHTPGHRWGGFLPEDYVRWRCST